jgi:predicted ATP-grasp superfamily ATP-dependent carboligase
MLLIVSFNARPLAQFAKELGLEVAIVDFWGDQDLFPLSNKIQTVFKPEFKSYKRFPDQNKNEELLVELALQVFFTEKIDSIIIGSGLDDRPDLWARLSSMAPILGNSPDCIKQVRDLMRVHKKLKENGIQFPQTYPLSEWKAYQSVIKFPFVIKPIKTLGGLGIRLIQDQNEFGDFLNQYADSLDNFFIQEYIKGEDISTTVIGNKTDYQILSINKQLIGIKQLGTELPFKYCGNVVPYDCPSPIAEKIANCSIKISKLFSLIGIFGIDFVLKDTTPYFMEINPRFPGTIELLHLLTNLNAIQLQINAIKGILPKKLEKPHGYAMKCVLFAKKQLVTPQLKGIPHLFDIPPPNLLLNKEDPIGTLLLFDKNLNELQSRMDLLVHQIYLRLSE